MRRPLRPDTYSHLFFRLNNLKVHDFFGLAILNFVSGFRSRPKKAKEYFFQRFKNIFLKLFFTFFDRFWKTFFLLRNEKWTKQQFNFFFSTSGEKNTKQLKIFVSWLGFRFFPSPEIRFGKVLEHLSELFLKTNTRQQHDSVGRSPKRRRRRRRSTMRRRCFNYSIADVISFLAEQFFRKLRRVRPRQRGQRFCLLLFFCAKFRQSLVLVSTVLSEVNDVDNDSDSDEDDDVDDVTSTWWHRVGRGDQPSHTHGEEKKMAPKIFVRETARLAKMLFRFRITFLFKKKPRLNENWKFFLGRFWLTFDKITTSSVVGRGEA